MTLKVWLICAAVSCVAFFGVRAISDTFTAGWIAGSLGMWIVSEVAYRKVLRRG